MENYTLLIMGGSNGDEDGSGAMKMAPGALPRPGRVPKQRLLSPELGFRMAAEHGDVFGSIVD